MHRSGRGGSGWTSIYDVTQQYMVGPNTAGGSWATCGQGEPIGPDAGFEYAVTVSGDEIVYEVGVTQFDNYGGFSGGDTIVTDINVGSVVRFDLAVDTRWSDGFGMLSENLMPGKFNHADSIAMYMLAEESGGPPCFERVADLDGNCAVNWADLVILVDSWLWGK